MKNGSLFFRAREEPTGKFLFSQVLIQTPVIDGPVQKLILAVFINNSEIASHCIHRKK